MSDDLTLSVVAAVNSDDVLRTNLAESPLFSDGVELIEERNHRSASQAYNAGMARCERDVIVFAHQDVYLPSRWREDLARADAALRAAGAEWAVLGLVGCMAGGQVVGRVYSAGLGREICGKRIESPPVVTMDEMVIVLRRDSGLSFDPSLPGFHLYGTDIVQLAISAGLGAYVVNAPAVHNSNSVRRLDENYVAAYEYMRRKWWGRLPIANLVVPITRTALELQRARLRLWWRSLSADVRARVASGRELASQVGYEP